jgi:hypothetical protein
MYIPISTLNDGSTRYVVDLSALRYSSGDAYAGTIGHLYFALWGEDSAHLGYSNPIASTSKDATYPDVISWMAITSDPDFDLNPGATGGRITCNPGLGFIEVGGRVELTAPSGADYHWKRDGNLLSDDPPRVTGTNERTLVLGPIEETDAGVYTCVYSTGAKAYVESLPLDLWLLLPGSLPVTGLVGLGVTVGVCIFAGVLGARRKK